MPKGIEWFALLGRQEPNIYSEKNGLKFDISGNGRVQNNDYVVKLGNPCINKK